ncbi:hypothetical protein KI688_009096 [Linnemannia hyalina]|uniref:Uncharacterized protein n=1 Tax=Linnemannia hyalina TaxID=64524 RepID=A0A9P7XZ05_9FUNG|nr:hypothetical protein KI688_009096 [Linnemannia hyalina]
MHAFAEGYGPNNAKPEHAILFRSNTNPASSTNITWTTISTFDSSKLAGYPNAAKGVDYSCAYNEQGVFTMFGRTTGGSPSVTTMVPFGVRYDPNGSMDPGFNYQGTGAWMNITVEGYTWLGGFTRFSLGYVKTGATKVLVHASISDTNNVVSLATVNDPTGILATTAAWTMNATLHGRKLLTVAIGNDHLYTYGEGVSENYRTYLTGLPLNSTTTSPSTPVSTSYNTTQAAECYGSPLPIVYFLNETLMLVCPEKKPDIAFAGEVSITLTITDPNTAIDQGFATLSPTTLIDMDFFVSIGDWHELGPSAFALVKSQGTIYAFGNGNYEGIEYNRTVSQVIVAEPYGIDLPTTSSSCPGTDQGRLGSTNAPPLSPTSPMPPYVQEQVNALRDQMRMLQEQISARRLSSNPRPDLPTPKTPTVVATATSAPTPLFAPSATRSAEK